MYLEVFSDIKTPKGVQITPEAANHHCEFWKKLIMVFKS